MAPWSLGDSDDSDQTGGEVADLDVCAISTQLLAVGFDMRS